MKLNIVSDLHLGQSDLELPRNDADVVILAGDIARPERAFAWAAALSKPVLYVPGNHEFYGSSLARTLAQLKALSAGTNIRVLNDDQVLIDGVRFLGTTLWSDFRLFGDGELRDQAADEALRYMRDYSRIYLDDAHERLFTPLDSAALFARHSAWLSQRLGVPYAGSTVVITHHAPSPLSIHPRFAKSMLNACFVSQLEHLARAESVQLWIHGHTHDSFDYMLNGTRVVCNPRGYAKGGVNENALFNLNYIVEVG